MHIKQTIFQPQINLPEYVTTVLIKWFTACFGLIKDAHKKHANNYKGYTMHIYHIIQAYDNKNTLDLTILDEKPVRRSISLNKSKHISRFKAGQDIIVLRDTYLDAEDVAYICDGQLYLNTRPHVIDQYGCQCLLEYVPDWKHNHCLDRDILNIAIGHECTANGIPISDKPNINLLNLLSNAKGY